MNAEPEVGGTEGIGVLIALVVLVVTFGSLVAAGMTMLNALDRRRRRHGRAVRAEQRRRS